MRIAAFGRSLVVAAGCFLLVSAQELSESARRVFSHGIIPIPQQEPSETSSPVQPPPPDSTPVNPVTPSPLLLNLVPVDPPATMPPDLPASQNPTFTSDQSDRATAHEVAETAWRYFDKDYEPATGWFDSVRGYPYTTMWDLSSGLAAVACAERLNVIPPKRGSELLHAALLTLAKVRLYNSELPNREYNTATAALSGPKETGGNGTGWSALDVGRLLIWLKIVATWHPEYAGLTHEIVQRWKFGRLSRGGEMFGVYYGGTREYQRQEGRLGYEQYSASGYELWGVPMRRARDYVETKSAKVLGVDLAADTRNLPFFTSEPFVLAALELGTIDPTYTDLTKQVYRVQELRWKTEHELTAASEDSLDRAPWFSYFNVYYEGQSWQCRSATGDPSAICGFSTKAAFGWAALFGDGYSRLLEETAQTLGSAGGYLAGKYPRGERNTSLNINTKAVILDAKDYRQRGRREFLEADR